ncbi:MAG: hypothetical protein ACKVTZ_04115 [Bacteroidia bacterium]
MTLVSREVFWATDANSNRSVLAIEFGTPAPHQQTIYQVKEADFAEKTAFEGFKDSLFTQWKNGETITFPSQIQKHCWDLNVHNQYPTDLPQPEKEDKLPQLKRKARKEVLQAYSEQYKTELIENISAFREKVLNSATFLREDYEFAQKYKDLVRTARSNQRNLEEEGEWEEECLVQADEKEVLMLLDDVLLRLNQLKEKVGTENYQIFVEKVAEIEAEVATTTEWREMREKLLGVKTEMREAHLERTQKDELFDRLNKAFDALSLRQTTEKQQYEQEAAINFAALNSEIEQQAQAAEDVEIFQPVREALKKIQGEVKDAKLTREQRNELFELLDKTFKRLAERQNSVQEGYEKASSENYTRLKERVEIGAKLANFSDDFNEAREYLKDVQADINEVKLTRTQRDELRQAARTAFEKLNERADKYYKDKRFAYEKMQKEREEMRIRKRQEWEFRQKEKIMRLEKDIERIQKSLDRDNDTAANLREELEVEDDAKLTAKLQKVDADIAEKSAKITKIKEEIAQIEVELNKE